MKKTPRMVTAFGETKSIREWIADERCGVSSDVGFLYRIKSGMSEAEAIETPSRRGTYDTLIGRKVGRLTVTSERFVNESRVVFFACVCECGSRVWRRAESLKADSFSTCGCNRSKISDEERAAKKRAFTSEWQKKNWDHKREYLRKWKAENKDKTAAYEVKRRGGWVVNETAIYRECQLPVAIACTYCGKITLDKSDRNVDHATPVSRGGTHEVSNLVVACKFCNLSKHVKTAAEYLLAHHAIEEVPLA